MNLLKKSKRASQLVVPAINGELLKDMEPRTDYLLLSEEHEVGFEVRKPMQLVDWWRDPLPGGQYAAPQGHGVWLMNNEEATKNTLDTSKAAWRAMEASLENERRKASDPDLLIQNQPWFFWLKVGVGLSVGFVIFACLMYLLKHI